MAWLHYWLLRPFSVGLVLWMVCCSVQARESNTGSVGEVPQLSAEEAAIAQGNERNRALLSEGSVGAGDSEGRSSRSMSALPGKANGGAGSALDLRGVKRSPARDAVAIVIGVQSYKYLPSASFASADARQFAEYARHVLGVPPNKIRVLTDVAADTTEMTRVFRQWLRRQVNRGMTDVYVFYSGHSLPSDDGKTLFLLPYNADRDLIDKTGISQQEVVAMISAVQPRSATLFIDSCYSGQTRSGEALLPDARPLSLRSSITSYPPEFSVLSASSAQQISWSSAELGHGLFSYYLMKGLEGPADLDRDGAITFGEMQRYLLENVARQAAIRNRMQEPQLIGDEQRTLVKR